MEEPVPAESFTPLYDLFLTHGADEDRASTLAKQLTISFGPQGYGSVKSFFDLGWSFDDFDRWTYRFRYGLKRFLPVAPQIEKALLDSSCPPRFARAAVQYRVILVANRPYKVAVAYHVLRPYMRNDLICIQALTRYAAGFLSETETLVAWIRRMQEAHLNPTVDTPRVMGRFWTMNRQPRQKPDSTEEESASRRPSRKSRFPPKKPYRSPYGGGRWKQTLQR